ncbi:MAG: glycosyltransferase, partial [Gammaproteobacteria bacterium]|nr:glycosyltransferase [Gammaproteobacteria bacterium]
IYANYITAIPWETKWDIQATAKMADEIAAEMPSWAYFTPYPGCELGEECIKKGWSLLNRSTYDRCPSGEKVKYVDYAYISDVRKGFREEVYPEFCDIIIPSYKNEQFTMNCLNSIKECTKPGTYRVIWVDNGSESSSAVDEVISQMDHLTIKLPTNEGFVGAINKGLEASDAPNVCLLNNDTVVSPRWLEKLISALAKYPKLGIVGALTNYGRGSAVDSHHSLSLHSSLLPKGSDTWDLAKINQHLEMGYLGRTHPITFVAFLCAIIKREVINKVGHLDPNFAMGMWDDLDYNRSVQAFGYKTELAIDTCIQHFGRSTFNLVQLKEKFDVNALLKVNKAYLDKKWEGKKFITKLPTAHDTIIISRAIYESMGSSSEIGILTEHRLSLMQRYFINSLKNQTDQDFAIHLIVGPENNETTKRIKKLNWEDLNINFIYSNEDLSQWKLSVAGSKNFGREIDNGCPEWIVKNSNHPRTSIMARLDTDDWIAPGWIAHMKYLTRTTPLSHFLINYQIIGQWTDGRLYNFNAAHTKARTSPFIVLVQKTDPRISPYEDLHLHMGGKFSLVLTIPPGYAFMVVHGENRSNRFYKNDTYIGGTDLVGYNPKVIPIASMEKGQVYIDNTVPGTDWRARIARVKVR